MSHDIVLAPPAELANNALPSRHRSAPAILQRSDEDFLEAVLEGLRTDASRRALVGSRAAMKHKSGALKLFQPVQRQFHIALLEAFCDQPGAPRLDPKRVESAGFVIRRLRGTGNNRFYEGWMRMRGRVRGWMRVERLGTDGADPQSGFRLARQSTGVADIDRALRTLDAGAESTLLEEHIVPMFMAPPDVCKEAGKTLFYGMLPTTSSEIAEGPVSLQQLLGENAKPFGPQDTEFRNHLVEGLRGESMDFPLDGETMHPGWFDAVESTGNEMPLGMSPAHWTVLVERNEVSPGIHRNEPSGNGRKLQRLIALLRQLALEFNAFDETVPESGQLRAVLREIRLPLKLRPVSPGTPGSPMKPREYVDAETFCKRAVKVLLERDNNATRPEMPENWPSLDSALRTRLAQKLSTAMNRRFADVKGAPGRYDEPDAQYAIRAFVREKPACGCPAKVHWSDYSEPFVIAPWFEGAGAPPTQVTLPDLKDIKGLKPNVSFVVPPSLQGLLAGSPKDMLEGKGTPGSEWGLTWICSFSLPIITLCAFIVLNIFLGLFDLIFRWLFFIKICIPFPKKD
ncbi:MAG: hypothetical protein REI94_08785 [Moraxellaceae bacterium]|nr:hypothetical protein [Moraxellaceae bacterium]